MDGCWSRAPAACPLRDGAALVPRVVPSSRRRDPLPADAGADRVGFSVHRQRTPVKRREFIRQHTLLGERILGAAPALRPVAVIVRASHERWDGEGYPDGLAGEAIPLGARIIAACDAYEAMTTDRCYRERMSHESACEELRREAGRQFDPGVVDELIAELDAGGPVDWAAVPEPGPLSPTADEVAAYLCTVLSGSLPARTP